MTPPHPVYVPLSQCLILAPDFVPVSKVSFWTDGDMKHLQHTFTLKETLVCHLRGSRFWGKPDYFRSYTDIQNLFIYSWKKAMIFLTNLTKEFDGHDTYFCTEKTVIALIRSNFWSSLKPQTWLILAEIFKSNDRLCFKWSLLHCLYLHKCILV